MVKRCFISYMVKRCFISYMVKRCFISYMVKRCFISYMVKRLLSGRRMGQTTANINFRSANYPWTKIATDGVMSGERMSHCDVINFGNN